jgi:Uma2 family endonuclease
MSPSGFASHGSTTAQITAAFCNAIDAVDCQAETLVEIDWIISANTVVRPDVAVICGRRPEKHIESAPAIIAEVLSPSTRQNDLTFKRELYEKHQVQWYLIFDPEPKTITALKLSADGKYETLPDVSNPLEGTICGDCDLKIDLQRVFR